jgi:hypothetical protein
VKDGNGNLIAIKSTDVGDNSITFGYGFSVKPNDTDKKKILESYNIKYDIGVMVDVDVAEKISKEFIRQNNKVLCGIFRNNNLEPNQQQIDALIIHRYLRPAMPAGLEATLIEMLKNNNMRKEEFELKYRDTLSEILLRPLKNLGSWGTYGSGWTRRVDAELDIFFNNKYFWVTLVE